MLEVTLYHRRRRSVSFDENVNVMRKHDICGAFANFNWELS